MRGPLMREQVITAAWAKNGWHGYRKGGSETAVPGKQRNLQQRLNRRASIPVCQPVRAGVCNARQFPGLQNRFRL